MEWIDPDPGSEAGRAIPLHEGVVYYNMITVPEAARRIGKNPETVRRWIREGKLPSQKFGTQHLVDERDLAEMSGSSRLFLPGGWTTTVTGEPMPDWVSLLRSSRETH